MPFQFELDVSNVYASEIMEKALIGMVTQSLRNEQTAFNVVNLRTVWNKVRTEKVIVT
jgi:hypothetical protein